ncbi:hypothetical protein LguiA_002515 [Lonicera macranthoides]
MPKTKFLGKVLENCKTLAEFGIHIGDLPGGVITMHVVVRPPVAKKKTCRSDFGKVPFRSDWYEEFVSA